MCKLRTLVLKCNSRLYYNFQTAHLPNTFEKHTNLVRVRFVSTSNGNCGHRGGEIAYRLFLSYISSIFSPILCSALHILILSFRFSESRSCYFLHILVINRCSKTLIAFDSSASVKRISQSLSGAKSSCVHSSDERMQVCTMKMSCLSGLLYG
jgi:hypothetical protein